MAIAPELARLPFCDVETVGRVTGRPHVVEMWFAADPEHDRVYLLSGGRDGSDWVLNLRHNPTARLRFGDEWLDATAREIEGRPEEALARQLLAAKYQGWSEGRPLSGWARNSLAVALDVLRPGSADGRGTEDR